MSEAITLILDALTVVVVLGWAFLTAVALVVTWRD